jgi:hypothetical protein
MIKKISFFLLFITAMMGSDFSRTNLQYLQGSGFDDIAGGYVVEDRMTTLTLEHYSTWGYGDNFFFVDNQNGDFDHFGGKTEYVTYMEWAPRLSLSKLSGASLQFGIVKDIYLSGQLNQGEGYRATLAGAGIDLALPFFAVFGVNVYHKEDNFDNTFIQTTLNWLLPAGPVVFEGFADFTEDDTLAQPQLLLDFRAFGLAEDKLLAGIELYYYKTDDIDVSVPQVMVKWVW